MYRQSRHKCFWLCGLLSYIFADAVRLGGDFVYRMIATSNVAGDDDKDKYEIVARVDCKYSPKLSFQAWYSYINVDGNTEAQSGSKNVRLQTLYQF
ncbi:major outer membrane protein [Campylobacter sp. US33a]|uniref:major outer membrane protein n=1 Tax=Campylobacter sp. US33a TaxID=2498120 RepID=UPI002444B2AC|nr:major outer membrane protein [Campylobacter sp. US33a]MCW1360873.1 major outer membrane protein [Campylobacter jejuni]